MSNLTAAARRLRHSLGAPRRRGAQPFDSWTKAQLWERILELEGKLETCRNGLSRAKGDLHDAKLYAARDTAGSVLDRTEYRPAAMGRRTP